MRKKEEESDKKGSEEEESHALERAIEDIIIDYYLSFGSKAKLSKWIISNLPEHSIKEVCPI